MKKDYPEIVQFFEGWMMLAGNPDVPGYKQLPDLMEGSCTPPQSLKSCLEGIHASYTQRFEDIALIDIPQSKREKRDQKFAELDQLYASAIQSVNDAITFQESYEKVLQDFIGYCDFVNPKRILLRKNYPFWHVMSTSAESILQLTWGAGRSTPPKHPSGFAFKTPEILSYALDSIAAKRCFQEILRAEIPGRWDLFA